MHAHTQVYIDTHTLTYIQPRHVNIDTNTGTHTHTQNEKKVGGHMREPLEHRHQH